MFSSKKKPPSALNFPASPFSPIIRAIQPGIVTRYPEGEARAEGWERRKTTDGLRIGIGHDTHRLRHGGPLRLGGIDIPHDRQMVGHSDADVLLHAITDALLGAAALGDIGQMFPDTDPANRGRDSAEMLIAARDAVTAIGFRIINIDCIVFAQRPKLLPYRQTVRERIADILQIEPERIGLKGKTGEGVGPIGLEEAISAECVALLEKEIVARKT